VTNNDLAENLVALLGKDVIRSLFQNKKWGKYFALLGLPQEKISCDLGIIYFFPKSQHFFCCFSSDNRMLSGRAGLRGWQRGGIALSPPL